MTAKRTRTTPDQTGFAPGRVLAFEVLGEPIPQRSNRAFVDPRTGKRVFKPDDKRLRPWRKKLAEHERKLRAKFPGAFGDW